MISLKALLRALAARNEPRKAAEAGGLGLGGLAASGFSSAKKRFCLINFMMFQLFGELGVFYFHRFVPLFSHCSSPKKPPTPQRPSAARSRFSSCGCMSSVTKSGISKGLRTDIRGAPVWWFFFCSGKRFRCSKNARGWRWWCVGWRNRHPRSKDSSEDLLHEKILNEDLGLDVIGGHPKKLTSLKK